MDAQEPAPDMLRLPFVFVPNGAEVPAAWRAAHPEAVSLPARLVVRMLSTTRQAEPMAGPQLQQVQWWLSPFLATKPPVGPAPRPMVRVPRQSGKEAASDTPGWSKGFPRHVGETPAQYARRLMDGQYGRGNWEGVPRRDMEFRKIQKYGARAFRDPGAFPLLPAEDDPDEA